MSVSLKRYDGTNWGDMGFVTATEVASSYAPISHPHSATDITSGTLPVLMGGTGNSSVDTVPTSGSSKMVTSGGVFNQLNNKINLDDVLMPTNPFGGRRLYINALNNAFYSADKRFYVTTTIHKKVVDGITYPYIDTTKTVTDDDYFVDSPVVSTLNSSKLFNGSYEDSPGNIPSDSYMKVAIQFNSAGTGSFVGYPYGVYYLSYYYTSTPDSAQLRVYNTFTSQTVGWKLFNFGDYIGTNANSGYIQSCADESDYSRTKVQFIIQGHSSHTTSVTQIDYKLTRPNLSRDGSTFTKYGAQKSYYEFQFGNQTSNNITINPNGNITALSFTEGGTLLSNKYSPKAGSASLTTCSQGTFGDMATKTASNYALASHTHSYLPLSGGTLTGALTVNGSVTSNSYIEQGQYLSAKYSPLAGSSSLTTCSQGTFGDMATKTASNYLPLSAGTSNPLTGHLMLNGGNANSSTGTTSQIVMARGTTQQWALSSNDGVFIINPSTSSTTNQFCYYFNTGNIVAPKINGYTLANGCSLTFTYSGGTLTIT